jgi:hypothetical protein
MSTTAQAKRRRSQMRNGYAHLPRRLRPHTVQREPTIIKGRKK